MDYYGKRLATASSDRTVKVFDVADDRHTLVAHLKGYRTLDDSFCFLVRPFELTAIV